MRADGFRLAVTTFTVAPLRPPGVIDRAVAGRAMRFAPWVGLALGGMLGGFHYGLAQTRMPGLLAAALTVGLGALLTRGLHLDGVADTVDALGSYRSRERALEIMKSPEVGPMGVVALVLLLLAQVAALTSVTWAGMAVAWAVGRLGAQAGCLRGVPSARADGLGALVAGTSKMSSLLLNAAALAALSVWAVPARPWQGPLALAAALLVVGLLLRHCVRRLGGITGDVLGLLVEAAATTVLIGLSV